MPLRRRDALLLALLPCAFTGEALLSGDVYGPIDLPYQSDPLKSMATQYGITHMQSPNLSDLYMQIIPWREAVRHAYSLGEWPLINPFTLCGDILAASAQSAPYHPLNLLSYLLPLAASLTFIAAMTFLLAAIGAYLYSREIGCRELPSLFGAAAWMFSNCVAFWLEWPIGLATALVPLVFFAVRRLVRVPSLRSMLTLCCAFVLLILAGHPETTFHVVAFGAIYGVLEVATRRENFFRATTHAVMAGALAVGICAIYLLPIFDALPQTAEYHFRREHTSSVKHSVSWSQAWIYARSTFVTFINGISGVEVANVSLDVQHPATGYAGSLLFPVALYGVIGSRKRVRWLLAAMFVVGLLCWTRAPGVIDLLALLPGFKLTLNERLVFLSALALAALGALGLDTWLTTRSRVLPALIALTFGAYATWYAVSRPSLIASGLSGAFVDRYFSAVVIPLVVAAVCLLVMWPRHGTLALIVILVAQRAFEPAGHFYPTLPARAFYPPIPVLDRLPSDERPYRIVGTWFHFVPGTSTLYGLEDVRGYQAMTHHRFSDLMPLWSFKQPVWFNRVEDLNLPMLKFLNVKYAVAPLDREPPPGWFEIGQGPRMRLLETEDFIPRAYIPRRVDVNSKHVRFGMGKANDFRERSWIEVTEGPLAKEFGDVANGRGTVEIHKRGLGFQLKADIQKDAWIVISQTGWRGWRAFKGRDELPLHTGNFAFLALHLPQGKHSVRLTYLPHSFVLGRAVTAVSLLAIVALAVAQMVSRRRSRSLAPLSTL